LQLAVVRNLDAIGATSGVNDGPRTIRFQYVVTSAEIDISTSTAYRNLVVPSTSYQPPKVGSIYFVVTSTKNNRLEIVELCVAAGHQIAKKSLRQDERGATLLEDHIRNG
jgi:hypothetical protein